MKLTRLEHRWAADGLSLLSGTREDRGGPAPREFSLTFSAATAAMGPKAALGLRLALWWLAWSPLWLGVQCTHLSAIEDEGRSRVGEALSRCRGSLASSLLSLLKMVAAMATFRSAERRNRAGYGSGKRRLLVLEDAS